ncbi:hypothetical protein BV201_01540A, partial [Haemophilus influenzae]
MKFLY